MTSSGAAGIQLLVAHFALTLARVLPIVVLAPFLGGRATSPAVRVGLAAGVAALALPHAPPPSGEEWLTPIPFVALIFVEAARGLALGFAAALVFWLAESAGRALDIARGANLAEVQAPALGHRASPLGQLVSLLLLVVFCRLDGPSRFLASVFESFRLVPVGGSTSSPTVPLDAGTVERLVVHFGDLTRAVLGLVLPGLAAALLVDLVFGAFNRIAPALNAYFLALGGKALAVVAMLALTLTVVAAEAPALIDRTLALVGQLAGARE